ncbi:hypothetical protein ACLI08_00885 [Flavobacterium sp. RNTU_13]|uniref:hypothetical protein n=1 Tax=Flavobacterium sp. RNTU_13 TaxID=3375145 RepID=UPI00398693BC
MKPFAYALLALFILTAPVCRAQDRCPVNGKVSSNFDDLEGIYVINRSTEATVFTKRGGYFSIPAAVNDTLLFSSIQFTAKEVVVKPEHFGSDLLIVPIEPMHRQLTEVIINDYSHINSVKLGLVPANQKKYTPAERRLATASQFKMNPLGLDPIFNAFSGRTAMLRKAAETEKKETLIDKIYYLYSEDDIVAKLKIPVEYVRGFLFYVVENKYLTKAIDEKNHEMARFMMSGLATKYLSLLNNDH